MWNNFSTVIASPVYLARNKKKTDYLWFDIFVRSLVTVSQINLYYNKPMIVLSCKIILINKQQLPRLLNMLYAMLTTNHIRKFVIIVFL